MLDNCFNVWKMADFFNDFSYLFTLSSDLWCYLPVSGSTMTENYSNKTGRPHFFSSNDHLRKHRYFALSVQNSVARIFQLRQKICLFNTPDNCSNVCERTDIFNAFSPIYLLSWRIRSLISPFLVQWWQESILIKQGNRLTKERACDINKGLNRRKKFFDVHRVLHNDIIPFVPFLRHDKKITENHEVQKHKNGCRNCRGKKLRKGEKKIRLGS